MRNNKKLDIYVDWQPMLNERSGIAFYISNLIEEIAKIDKYNNYYLVGITIRNIKEEFNIGKNFYTRYVKFLPRRLYLKLLEIGINIPIDRVLSKKFDIYFNGNFTSFPHTSGKSIVVVHDLAYLKYPETLEKKNLIVLKRHVPRSINDAAIIIAVSQTIKDQLIEEYNVDHTKVKVIYPFVKLDSNTKITVSKNKKINDLIKTKYMLFLGNIEPRKNVINIVKAYRLLPDEVRSQYKLLLAGGKGWGNEEILNEINSPIDIGQIEYLGYIDNDSKTLLYKHAKIFIYPSLYEGFGIPILEAMNNKIPVIISNRPSLPEVAGDAALYVDPLNIKDISDKIFRLLQNTDLQNELIEKGQKRVDFFKNQNQGKQLLNIFNQLS